MMARKHKLTEKQKRFVAEYQIDLNGTQAAIRAGYSPKTAEVIANHLVKKSWVLEAIKKQTEARLHKVGVRSDAVLTRMARLGFADIRKLYRDDGTLLPPHEWPDEIVPCVAGVESFEEYQGKGDDRHLIGFTRKVRLWDPNPALTNIAKNLGIIGNRKHRDEEAEEGVVRVWTSMELAAKLFYYNQIIKELVAEVERKKESEAQKALSGKSLDKNP
jgi:phage terminase small subunit